MEVIYTSYKHPKTIFVGTDFHFDLSEMNGEYPRKINNGEFNFLVSDGYRVCKEQSLSKRIMEEVYSYRERNKFKREWMEFEWNDEFHPELNSGNLFYNSGDNEVPVHAYNEDWK